MTLTLPINVTAFYTGLAALWLAFLALGVVRYRIKYRVGLGAGGQPALERAQRVHGNATEWLPLGLGLILVLELMAAPIWLLHLLGVSLAAARGLHAAGLWRTRAASWQRSAGMVLQLGQYAVGGAACLLYALVI
jgi:uncharacterized membrane protein YecN with MAPEG domain